MHRTHRLNVSAPPRSRLARLAAAALLALTVPALGLASATTPAAAEDVQPGARALACHDVPANVWVSGFGIPNQGDPAVQYLLQIDHDGDLVTRTVIPSRPMLNDLAWSADGKTLYGVASGTSPNLTIGTVDVATGAWTPIPITGPANTDTPVGSISALTLRPNGNLIFSVNQTMYEVEVPSGVSTRLPNTLPTGYVSGGDYLTLENGDVIAALIDENRRDVLVRIDPDTAGATPVVVGSLPPSSWGAALSGGDVYVGNWQGLHRLTSIPTTAGTDPVPMQTVTTPASLGLSYLQIYGATSTTDSSECDAPVASGDSATTVEDVAVTIDVLDNDAAAGEDAPLTPSSVRLLDASNQPATSVSVTGGTYTTNGDGTITFTPDAGFVGTVGRVAYRVSDSNSSTADAVIETTVTAAPDDPAIDLTKTATLDDTDGDGFADVGETIAYSFTVTNTGGYPVTDVEVADPTLATVTCTPTALDPGEDADCTTTTDHTVTQAEVDAGEPVSNAATATADDPDGNQLTSTDLAQVPTVDAAPELDLDKFATLDDLDADGVADLGETIRYDFTVTNTGNVTIEDIAVDDPLAGAVTCIPTRLAPGEDADCTATTPYPVDEDDLIAGSVDNTATATGSTTAATPEDVTSPAAETSTPTADAAPAITLVKFADHDDTDGDGAVDLGETVDFSFRVTNTGNLTLNQIAIDDRMVGAVTCQATTLAPRADTTCTAITTYAITQADVDAGEVVNIATVQGTPVQGADVGDTDTITTPAIPTPEVSLVKTATLDDGDGDAAADLGETIGYTFRAINVGNTTLTDVAVSDPALGAVSCDADTLAPNEETDCTAAAPRTVTQADVDSQTALTNTAEVEAEAPDGSTITDDDTATTPVAPAVEELSLVKAVTPGGDAAFVVGAELTYTMTATNTGNVTLTDVVIDEQSFTGTGTLSALSCDAGDSVAPGEDVVCTATYTLTQADIDAGSVTNTADATGDSPDGSPVDAVPSSAVAPAPDDPELVIVKTTDKDHVESVGERLTYLFTVSNTGNVPLTDVEVQEEAFSGSGDLADVRCPAAASTLGLSATVVCSAVYTVTEADLGTDVITNTASASATDPTGATIAADPSSAQVPVRRPASIGLTKVADTDTARRADQIVIYTFTMTNTGGTELSDLAVEERDFSGTGALTALSCADDDIVLGPTESTTCTATYTVTEDDLETDAITNTAVARAVEGAPAQGPTTLAIGDPVVSDEASAEVLIEVDADEPTPSPDPSDPSDDPSDPSDDPSDPSGDPSGPSGDPSEDSDRPWTDGGPGHLSDTGGPGATVLIGALALITAGGAALVVARGRRR